MTTNLNIESVLPTYSLTETVATKAIIDNAFTLAGNPSDGDSLTVTVDSVVFTITFATSASTPSDANTVEITIGSDAATNKNRIKQAINGNSSAFFAYGANLDTQQGIDGLSAVDGSTGTSVKIQSEDAGVSTIAIGGSATNVTLSGTTSATGTDASGALSINLSDLNLSANAFTTAEAASSSGDYRKLLFHVVEKFQQYISSYEQVSSITITTPGTNYEVGDTVNFSGGSSDVTAVATVSSVDASGGVTGITISNPGKGYSSAPSATLSSTAGTGCVLAPVITDRVPENLSITRGSLSEDTDTSTLSRTFGITFGFESTSLDIKAE
jgi:hypothetical protein